MAVPAYLSHWAVAAPAAGAGVAGIALGSCRRPQRRHRVLSVGVQRRRRAGSRAPSAAAAAAAAAGAQSASRY